MPNIKRYSIDRIDEELDRVAESGVKSLLIFGIPKHKDECGSEAYNDNGITQQAIRHIKEKPLKFNPTTFKFSFVNFDWSST